MSSRHRRGGFCRCVMAGCSERLGSAGMPWLTAPIVAPGVAAPAEGGRYQERRIRYLKRVSAPRRRAPPRPARPE
jgi:hypothetical protein